MEDRKTHIKRTQDKTFCEIGWDKYRRNPGQRHKLWWDGHSWSRYEYDKELPTAPYESADCMTCLASFKATVEGLVRYGNIYGLMSVISKMKNNAVQKSN